jgi:hypothetical protein
MSTALIALVILVSMTSLPPTVQSILFTTSQASIVEIKFEMDEEQPAGTLVGSVRDSPALRRRFLDDVTGVEMDVVDRMRFSFRQLRQPGPPYEYFSIDEQTGELRTTERLDRERVCPTSRRSTGTTSSPSLCRLVLDISIRPLRYSQPLRVVVDIRDINDNAPTFAKSRDTVYVSEIATPGASFELPVANDDDAPPFGIREYFLSDPSDFFELELVGGLTAAAADNNRHRRRQLPPQDLNAALPSPEAVRLRLKTTLDRETAARHRVVVVAVDGGNPPRSGSVEVDVIVVDANDNAPQFDRPVYKTEIAENRKSRTPIARLRATDADEGNNGVVVYGIIRSSTQASFANANGGSSGNPGDSSLFRIDADTGDLYPVRSLDRETDGNVFHLTAVASDRGSTPLSAFVRVTITVRDENDNAPEVTVVAVADSTESVEPEVVEHSAPGTFIAQVIAVDRDEGPNGSVECWTDGRQFRLEPVSLSMVADNSEKDEGHVNSAVVGREDDENDEISDDRTPVARSEQQLQQREKERVRGEGGGKSEYRLRSVVSFDREVASDVVVTVFCRDGGTPPLRVAKDVVVRIGDVNDHAPVITGGDQLSVDVVEGNAIGSVVYNVTATDADLGDNAKVTFDLTPMRLGKPRVFLRSFVCFVLFYFYLALNTVKKV